MTVRSSRRRRFLAASLASTAVWSLRLAWPGDALAEPEEPPAEPVPKPDAAEEPLEFVSSGTAPVSLAIPALGVSAAIQPVAQDPDGSMSAPSDPDQVAWYTLGPGMGVGGNVVFAAHIDWGNRPRVFARLDALDKGDAILIVDANGDGYEYLVNSSHWVRAEGAPVEEIFAQTTEAEVTLITCGGEYRPATREYLDRLIVKARGA
jgi:LPXTG-site transpeptidase (sortase) family protein